MAVNIDSDFVGDRIMKHIDAFKGAPKTRETIKVAWDLDHTTKNFAVYSNKDRKNGLFGAIYIRRDRMPILPFPPRIFLTMEMQHG